MDKIKDGDMSTCLELSDYTNDTWWMVWVLEEPIRIKEVKIKLHDVTTCSGNIPVVGVEPLNMIKYKYCEKACINGHLFYPEKLSEMNKCSYISTEHSAIYSDTLYFSVPAEVIICDIMVY